ncbi:putative gustatory receptor 59b [Drosophila montana]|uniref:putative gustatory receptor 59b n=1 Tax=Drosophila montana TaxID=40370 RepID=UPI00313E7AF9
MVGPWLLQCYHNYALLVGVTSYRRVAGSFRQTWLTRSYALFLNVLTLSLLPGALWFSLHYIKTINSFPNLIIYTTYILYTVSYAAVAYTLISRGSRDKALLEVERIVNRLKGQKKVHNVLDNEGDCGSLAYLFQLKLGTMLYLCLTGMTSCLMMPNITNWMAIICAFFFGNTMNIPLLAIYRYFLALWDIAYCYQYLNSELEHFMSCVRQRYPTNAELEELQRLWSLHSLLTRCTLRINKIYGLLLLTTRFDNLVFCVVYGYWGILFSFSIKAPIYMLVFGATNYNMRLLDFYLLNFMCDQTVRFQSSAHHVLSEGYWFKELDAYVLYVCTSKLNLWVCGLYKVNRRCWFQMIGSIFGFSILLLQFHLLLNKYTL